MSLWQKLFGDYTKQLQKGDSQRSVYIPEHSTGEHSSEHAPVQEQISNIEKVWDNGATSEFDSERKDLVEFHQAFGESTGAKYPVATRWHYKGFVFEDPNCPVPIPDGSGLVYAAKAWKSWIVLGPDGKKRLTIRVPRVREQSSPEDGDLGMPKYRSGMPKHIMYGEGGDGYQDDVRFYFDMHTGDLIRAEFVGRHW